MFIKVSGSTILNHWDHADEGLGITTEIADPPPNSGGFPTLVNDNGDYKYKYVDGTLVGLSEQEIAAHPNYKTRKLLELQATVSAAIEQLEEPKAHSLGSKKAMGGTLTQDESDFVAAFILARQAILDAYDVAKAAYL